MRQDFIFAGRNRGPPFGKWPTQEGKSARLPLNGK